MRCRGWLINLLLALLVPVSAPAQIFSGKVVAIKDGDTIEVMRGGQARRIRLYGIDCPEKGQAFGERARQATAELAFGQVAEVEVKDHDHYGRLVAQVRLNDLSLNRELVAAGFCWWYKYYAADDAVLESLEAQARREKKGLWSDPHAVPPWEFRRAAKR